MTPPLVLPGAGPAGRPVSPGAQETSGTREDLRYPPPPAQAGERIPS